MPWAAREIASMRGGEDGDGDDDVQLTARARPAREQPRDVVVGRVHAPDRRRPRTPDVSVVESA